MSKQSNFQIYQMFVSIFISISKGQLILDGIKQILTTINLFHPLILFKYLSKDSPILQRKHLISFLQENNFKVDQNDIKIIFGFQGVKDKMNYSTFLKMIYPYSMIANREISTVHLKNYYQTENLAVTEDVLAAFFLLITEHIKLINRLEVQKHDTLGKVSQQKIHKVLKNIKKLTQKHTVHCQKNDQVLTSLQLMHFVKNFTDIDQNTLFYLIRKLQADHLGCISIQKIQSFLKPWKKQTPTSLQNKQNKQIEKDLGISLKFNEQNYRKQLHLQLSKNVNLKKSQIKNNKNSNRKDGLIKIKQGQNQQKTNKLQKQFVLKTSSFKNKSPLKQSTLINQSSNKKKSSHMNGSDVKLFIKFIQTFLKNIQQIQKLKLQLNQNKQLSYLKIFKSLDKYERGVITSEELENFYYKIGGSQVSINFNILMIEFSANAQNWLSYSEFCQIFKTSIQRSQKSHPSSSRSPAFTSQQINTYFSQILYLTLLNEYQLLQIRRQFKKSQPLHLFSLINKQNTGFINYQELKKFLISLNFTQLSMYDLMLILKKLDKSKNGVVSQNQFIDYFRVEM